MSKTGTPEVTTQSPMTCLHFKAATPFTAQFCQDMVTGGTPLIDGTLQSLSDHDPVVATINVTIPDTSNNSALSDSAIKTLFQDTYTEFNAQYGACGQDGMTCFKDSMCCSQSEYSFDGKAKGCYIQDSTRPVC